MTRSLLALVSLLLFACSSEPGPPPLPPATSASGPTVSGSSASSGIASAPASATASASAITSASAVPTSSAEPTASAEPTTSAASKPGEVDRIVLRFQDASVPPPHHRSYTITLTPTRLRKVVDSYGDVISDEDDALASGEFAGFVRSLQKLGLKSGATKGSDGCTGGTSRSLVAYAGSTRVIEVSSASCGGKESGPLTQAKAWVEEVEKRAPGLGPKSKR